VFFVLFFSSPGIRLLPLRVPRRVGFFIAESPRHVEIEPFLTITSTYRSRSRMLLAGRMVVELPVVHVFPRSRGGEP